MNVVKRGMLVVAAGLVLPHAVAGQHAPHAAARVPVGDVTGVVDPVAETVPVVTVEAHDFSFDAPAEVPAGRTTIRLVNHGQEIHHVQVVRLEDGHTLAELLETLAAGGPPPTWARDVGGPNVALPGGGEFSATVNLRPGSYGLLCLIPSPDGVLHVAKGMSRTLTVTEPEEMAAAGADGVAELPEDLTLTLSDYAFGFSKALTAGTHRIRVRTVGRQSHEIVFFRLEPDRSARDVLAWFEEGQNGPPPGLPVGGVVGLAPGEENEFTLTFEPGRYAFICFLPDVGDGAPHFVHGMVQDYEVR